MTTTGSQSPSFRVALIGARGHVGSEIIRLLARHPRLELAVAASRTLAGTPVNQHVPEIDCALSFEDLGPEQIAARGVDVHILALPNGLADEYVATLDRVGEQRAVVIDVSADHRFVAPAAGGFVAPAASPWVYGQPERFRDRIRGARRIANPGCYATAAQLAIAPVRELLGQSPHVFGVSGYSGAGTKPSPKNDPEVLRDNLLPYSLTGHLHQRELSHHLGIPVYFTPHVAPFFRGITVTVSMVLSRPIDAEGLEARYRTFYAGEPLIQILGQEIPLVRDIAGRHHVAIGGLSVDTSDPQDMPSSDHGRHIAVVATLDNLLKGAATQAMQNINLALGIDEFTAIVDP